MTTKRDDLADALNALMTPRTTLKPKLRIIELFGDRPAVLEAIKSMHARNFTYAEIADRVTELSGIEVNASCVTRWLKAEAVRNGR